VRTDFVIVAQVATQGPVVEAPQIEQEAVHLLRVDVLPGCGQPQQHSEREK
jgi:hypothetical protein